jgi:plasmid maintenance system antidote protein VapI
VKGHPITIGQILADFVASCNGKIVETLTQILHFLKKELSRWAEERANISGTNNDTKMRLVSK